MNLDSSLIFQKLITANTVHFDGGQLWAVDREEGLKRISDEEYSAFLELEEQRAELSERMDRLLTTHKEHINWEKDGF